MKETEKSDSITCKKRCYFYICTLMTSVFKGLAVKVMKYLQNKFHKCRILYLARSHKPNTMVPAALIFIQAF